MNKELLKNFVLKHKTDIIVVASLLLLSVALLIFVNLTKEDGAVAEVRIDGKVVAEYSLGTNGTYTLNGGTNILTIEDGIAYMSYSECKGHQCEKMGKVRYVGEFIECAPNRIKIVITGTGDGSVDIIS